jgi:hypothetical protein
MRPCGGQSYLTQDYVTKNALILVTIMPRHDGHNGNNGNMDSKYRFSPSQEKKIHVFLHIKITVKKSGDTK